MPFKEFHTMKKLIHCLLLLGFASLNLYADDDECCNNDNTNYLCEFTTGYRQDNLKVHVIPASDGALVASTNNFKNVDIFQGRLTFKAETCYSTYSRAYFNYGRLVEFRHEFISPTLLPDPSKTHHEKGRVYDTEYAFGFSWYPCNSLRFTPLTGYSYHRIEFESHNRVPIEANASDYFSVVSKQCTTWRAPFVGMEMEFLLCENTRICLNGQYLWAHYNNHGHDFEKYNQNYRYKQRANGQGAIFYGEIGYAFLTSWQAVVAGGYQYWHAKGGTDKTTYTGPMIATTKSHLKTVSWQSYEVSIGLAYDF